MNDLLDSLAAPVARNWVAVYTLGLPPSVRDARRAELQSDLWEQRLEIRSGTSNSLAKGVLARVLGGVPADILWAIAFDTIEEEPSGPLPVSPGQRPFAVEVDDLAAYFNPHLVHIQDDRGPVMDTLGR